MTVEIMTKSYVICHKIYVIIVTLKSQNHDIPSKNLDLKSLFYIESHNFDFSCHYQDLPKRDFFFLCGRNMLLSSKSLKSLASIHTRLS